MYTKLQIRILKILDKSTQDASLEKSLNYSKEEVQLLARRAEEMILSNVKYESFNNCNDQSEADTSDSDYGSRASREWFVSSEPNITQRRMSPQRKLLKSRRKDWRHSLPECLEYSPLPLPGPLLKPSRGSKECDFKETKRHLGNHGSVPRLLVKVNAARVIRFLVPAEWSPVNLFELLIARKVCLIPP